MTTDQDRFIARIKAAERRKRIKAARAVIALAARRYRARYPERTRLYQKLYFRRYRANAANRERINARRRKTPELKEAA